MVRKQLAPGVVTNQNDHLLGQEMETLIQLKQSIYTIAGWTFGELSTSVQTIKLLW